MEISISQTFPIKLIRKCEILVTYSILIMTLGGCDYMVLKNSSAPLTLGSSQVDYSAVNQAVFQGFHCVTCHGAGSSTGVFLDSYSDVMPSIPLIKSVIESGIMPPSAPLPTAEKEMILDWIAAGAPEFLNSPAPSGGPATPVPDPTPLPPLAPTYASLNANIFLPKCVICHSAAGSASKVPLDTLDAIVNATTPLVTPANPTQSLLYRKVTSATPGAAPEMPPPKDGFSPLSDDEQANILQWIANLPQ